MPRHSVTLHARHTAGFEDWLAQAQATAQARALRMRGDTGALT